MTALPYSARNKKGETNSRAVKRNRRDDEMEIKKLYAEVTEVI
jgi:hypothetical protein